MALISRGEADNNDSVEENRSLVGEREDRLTRESRKQRKKGRQIAAATGHVDRTAT